MTRAILPGAEEHYTAIIGSGEPTTVFAHGFGGSIRDTRPFATGIRGTKVFPHMPGHGGNPSPGPGWDYPMLAHALASVLERTDADHALGVSMSAGALARLITDGHPAARSLKKVAFVLPASWTTPPEHLMENFAAYTTMLRGYVESGDEDGLAHALLEREAPEVRQMPEAQQFARGRARAIMTTDLKDGIGLARQTAVDNPAGAADFAGEVLVLTHEDDNSHPVEVAQKYAAAFPSARLEVLPRGSILWRGRQDVRRILGEFFGS